MELPEATASIIIVTHKGNPRNRDKLQDYNEWLLKTADLFARVFFKFIK